MTNYQLAKQAEKIARRMTKEAGQSDGLWELFLTEAYKEIREAETKHTPRPCQCNGSPIQRTICVNLYQVHCNNCGRRGVIAGTMDLAIADWNLQTAAPDQNTALKKAQKAIEHLIWIADPADEHGDEDDILDEIKAAITKAEPKG